MRIKVRKMLDKGVVVTRIEVPKKGKGSFKRNKNFRLDDE